MAGIRFVVNLCSAPGSYNIRGGLSLCWTLKHSVCRLLASPTTAARSRVLKRTCRSRSDLPIDPPSQLVTDQPNLTLGDKTARGSIVWTRLPGPSMPRKQRCQVYNDPRRPRENNLSLCFWLSFTPLSLSPSLFILVDSLHLWFSLHLLVPDDIYRWNNRRSTFTSVTRKVRRLIIDKGGDERSKFPARGNNFPLKVWHFKRRTQPEVPFANLQLLPRRKGLTLSGGAGGLMDRSCCERTLNARL